MSSHPLASTRLNVHNPDLSTVEAIPFLKWPGGKRWLVQRHSSWLERPKYSRLIEPFLGGGSTFFHLNPRRALLGDVNPDVIEAFRGIKDDHNVVRRHLAKHQRRHSKEHYYYVRSMKPRTPATRAARIIYLNRTCFNGIYRVNLRGVFNVPMGSKQTVTLPTDDFEMLASRLANAELHQADFEELVEQAGKGDLVFADPPYTVRHNFNGFVKYNETLFSWDDQVRLAQSLASARDRGAEILVTNAAHNSIRGLYARFGFYFRSVDRYSSIAATGECRGQYGELLISSERSHSVS